MTVTLRDLRPVFEVEQATVYRANGRRFLTQAAAIKAYAKGKFRAKHPCECEPADYPNYNGYDCGCGTIFDRVMPRYLRMLKRCLRKAAAK